jgi:tight adherence protein B
MNILAAALIGAAVCCASYYLFVLRAAGWGGEIARLERRAAELGDPIRMPLGIWTALAIATVAIGSAAGLLLLAAPLGVLVLQVPRWWLSARVAARDRAVRDGFGTAIQAMVEAVRSGAHIEAAMAAVANDASGFTARVLQDVSHQLKGGLTLGQVLPALRDRLKLDCVALFVATVLTCTRFGGPMADALEAVAETVRARQRVERYADVQIAAGRQQLRMLAVFPVAFLVLMSVLFPDGVSTLFATTGGKVVLLLAGGFVYLGIALGRRIIDRASGHS